MMLKEDWNLEVVDTTSRFYYSTPDGKLFADLSEANTYAQNILLSSKIQEYQQSDNPGAALATDLANTVKRIAVPVNEFSIKGSESDGAVFFDPETLEYKLVAASDGGSIDKGSFIKENGQVFLLRRNSVTMMSYCMRGVTFSCRIQQKSILQI